jgi:hypothetical protein
MNAIIKNMEAVFFCAALLGLNVAWLTNNDYTDIQISGQLATTPAPPATGHAAHA